MRVALAVLAWTMACGFQSPRPAGDDDDVIPDAAVARTRADLIGLWEFDETGGTTIQDTSDLADKVPLTVSSGSVAFSMGTMTIAPAPGGLRTLIASGMRPRLNDDVRSTAAVTLEAWVVAGAASQGSEDAPAVIAGLCSTVNSRNISLMQAGKRWLARVRTASDVKGATNGKPDLLSTAEVVPGALTHLVVVDDANQRVLYVNGKPDRVDPRPIAPSGWEKNYRMALGNEASLNRGWAGTFALVAMYKRALSAELVDANFRAGPASH